MTILLKNPHPGQILKEEFLEPLSMSQNALATALGIPANRISEIVRARRAISADTDLRLCRYLGLTEGFWLRLQNSYDMLEAKRQAGKSLNAIKPFKARQVA